MPTAIVYFWAGEGRKYYRAPVKFRGKPNVSKMMAEARKQYGNKLDNISIHSYHVWHNIDINKEEPELKTLEVCTNTLKDKWEPVK